jgi:hypothetical protein
MKKYLVLIALFITASVFSQGTPTVQRFQLADGVLIGCKWSDVDSTETVYSNWFDASEFNGQNTIYSWIVVDGAGTVDSLTLVTIEGRYPPLSGDGSTSYITNFTIDTIATNKSTGIQTIFGQSYSSTVQRGVQNDTVFVLRNVPPVRTFPQWRFKVVAADLTVSEYDMVVRVYIYAQYAKEAKIITK